MLNSLRLAWRVVWRELAAAARHKWLWLVRVGWIGLLIGGLGLPMHFECAQKQQRQAW